MKCGEMPAEGLRREIGEELGLRVDGCRLLHVDGGRGHLTLYYAVEVSGVFCPSVELVELQPFGTDVLPECLSQG